MAARLRLRTSIPCWFSTPLIAAAALICTAVAKRMWDRRWRGARSFACLALALWWVSLDENLSFHEKLTGPMQQLIGEGSWLMFAWVVVGGAVGMEMVASFVATRITWHTAELYNVCVVIEESGEMIGMILMIQGMALQLNRVCNPASAECVREKPPSNR